jgi:hypothetical protein
MNRECSSVEVSRMCVIEGRVMRGGGGGGERVKEAEKVNAVS